MEAIVERRRGERRRGGWTAVRPPWVWAVCGAAGATVILALARGLSLQPGDEPGPVSVARVVPAAVALPFDSARAQHEDEPILDAPDASGFEALMAAGAAAVGRRVSTTVYCESIRPRAVRRGTRRAVSPSVLAAADSSGRVPAAECRWGSGASAPRLLVVVPPAMAAQFGSMPAVEGTFIARREVPAEVEWLGQSEPFALWTVVVLRSFRS